MAFDKVNSLVVVENRRLYGHTHIKVICWRKEILEPGCGGIIFFQLSIFIWWDRGLILFARACKKKD
jgi:hypothetical protein